METGRGIIGLWARSENYRRIGEYLSGGIGPHELKTMPDDKTIVIAHGGIRTHPDTGREKLNLKTMSPNLSFLNDTGIVQSKIELAPDLHQNSIRHLDVSADGLVAFGMQWQGDISETPDLVGVVNTNGVVQLFRSGLTDQIALQNYVGSVAISFDGKTIGVTAPKGNRAHFYDTKLGFITVIKRNDICGIAVRDNGFMTTDGNGGLFDFNNDTLSFLAHQSRSWDNHLIKIP